MKQLAPYLMFNGNCEEAIYFYKDCLDGSLGYMGRFGEGPDPVSDKVKNKIMHVELRFDGGAFMASDHYDEAQYTTPSEASNIHLSLGFDSEEKLRQTFEKLSKGGEITMPLKKQFWGSIFGMITDKYGFKWMLSHDTGKKESA